MDLPWKRVIRFIAEDGRILLGEPILPHADFDVGQLNANDELEARVILGEDLFDTTGASYVSDGVVKVVKLLGPLESKDVPILRCIGLNYLKHIKEGGRTPPPFPAFFIKANTTIIGQNEPVVIPKIAQDEQADYEGELCLVIGKDARNVPYDEAFDYIGAFTVGNDVSSRKYQRDPKLAGNAPQWNFSKGFDTYAPLGPCLVSTKIINDPKELQLKTTIDGELRQDALVSDLLFDCQYLISYLSQGTTLQKGSVIMTGTPSGVGYAMNPPRYLQPGTRMEVNISKIGTLKNIVRFE